MRRLKRLKRIKTSLLSREEPSPLLNRRRVKMLINPLLMSPSWKSPRSLSTQVRWATSI